MEFPFLVRIPGLSIDGGTVQPDIDDIDACWEACRDGCKSADYNTHLRRCSFYYNNSCQMGHSALGNVHLQKSYCRTYTYNGNVKRYSVLIN